MRVLVTGATGFVGRWLIPELEGHGHDAIAAPPSAELSVTDELGVRQLVNSTRPDAIAHLAGMAFAADAARDPAYATAVNSGGTRAVTRAAAREGRVVPILVTGSADVYGTPALGDLPLRETAPLLATEPYGRSKLEQEAAALELGRDLGVPTIVTRSFNHTGPGQRRAFVAPALATRILDAKSANRTSVPVGNLDVFRDLADVRDVVRAYRLLLEGLRAGAVEPGSVVNVATGQTISIRRLFELIALAADWSGRPSVDPRLVRDNDPPVLVGDPSLLYRLTGWKPRIPIDITVQDLVASIRNAR